jgi:hypothetical protein
MDFELGTAILAGLAGTAAMTTVMYMGFAMNMRMDMPMTLGTMFLPKGPAAWVLGLMLHFMMGAVFFIIYGALFDAFAVNSGVAGVGALFGLVHGVAAGAAMGMMPVMHPRMVTAGGPGESEGVVNPGFFATTYGAMGAMALIGVHVLYGLVGGLVYAA